MNPGIASGWWQMSAHMSQVNGCYVLRRAAVRYIYLKGRFYSKIISKLAQPTMYLHVVELMRQHMILLL